MKLKIFLIVSLLMLGVGWWVSRPDGKTRVIFCDVGQGDGILIVQNNFQMIIDTGPENKKMLSCLQKHLPFWDKNIEAAIITHNDSDHNGGLKEIKKYYRVNEQYNYSIGLHKGDIIRYSAIVYEVMSPDVDWGNDNENSIVGWLKVKDKNFLLMADVTTQVEQKMVWRGVLRQALGQAQGVVLKISHHGSAEATSQELLDDVKPVEAIISVGKNNKFGHPTKMVIDRLNNAKIPIWRTDLQGERVFEL